MDFEQVKNSGPVLVIAEAGLNHNGSVEMAKRLIDSAVLAGADVVKFQKRTVDKLAVGEVLDAEDGRFPEFGKTYREIREHIEFDADEFRELKDYCDQRGVEFLCTAFDTDAVDFLEALGVEGYKLASHSLGNLPLLEYVAEIGKPAILSTGMCDLGEIDTAVSIFTSREAPLLLLHCVSAYPTPMDKCNLSMINVLSERYDVPVGYSGHELGYLPTLAAVARGARAIERHITLDSAMMGFDHKLSLEPNQLFSMIRDIRDISATLGDGQKAVSDVEQITRDKYHVSMVSAVDIPAGAELTPEMVVYMNPGTGIPPKSAHSILHRKAAKDIKVDTLLSESMFE